MPYRDLSGTIARFGPFEFDASTGELRKQGTKIRLQGQPVEILRVLLARPGTVVTREELQRKLWSDSTFVDFESSLNAAVKRLRAALCDAAESPRFVETLARQGYRFIAAVEFARPVEAGPSPRVPSDLPRESIDSSGNKPAPASPSTSQIPKRFGRFAALAASAIVAFMVLGVLIRRHQTSAKSAPSSPIHSLAVLPLANLSNDPQQEYFVDGMTEELITQLGKISALRVTSRTSAMTYKTTQKQLPQIARELHVDGIVEGAVLRSGNRVRVTAQLIEGQTDRHLWAQDYEGDVQDVLALQSRVAQAIAGAIQARLTADEQRRLASVHPVDPEAYEDYLRGRYYWYQRIHRGGTTRISLRPRNDVDFESSGRYFEKAVEKDPASALAYTGLTFYYGASSAYGLIPPKTGMPKAEAAARKALELDDSLAEAHASMAGVKLLYDWDLRGAEQEFQRAIELNPSYPEPRRMYSALLVMLGRDQEAMAQAETAEELDPLTFQGTKAVTLTYLHRYDAAIAEYKDALLLNPSSVPARYGLASAYLDNGMTKEAIEETEKALTLSGDANGAETIRKTYEKRGYQGVIELRLGQLREKSKGAYVSPLDFAALYAELGDKEQAFAWLDKAYQERASFLIYLGLDSSFDKIRSDPRFENLLRKIGLPH